MWSQSRRRPGKPRLNRVETGSTSHNSELHITHPPDCGAEDQERFDCAVGEAHRRYTRRINFREKWRGYFWQGRFASFVMDEPYLLAAARYVELNPVRAKLASKAEKWPWSSARGNYGDEKLTNVSPLLAIVADWRGFLDRHDAKRSFVTCEIKGSGVFVLDRTGERCWFSSHATTIPSCQRRIRVPRAEPGKGSGAGGVSSTACFTTPASGAGSRGRARPAGLSSTACFTTATSGAGSRGRGAGGVRSTACFTTPASGAGSRGAWGRLG